MDSNVAYICDAVRTPIGRFGGALSAVCQVSRSDQDAFAARSQARAAAAQDSGFVAADIASPAVMDARGRQAGVAEQDELPCPETTEQDLAALKPRFPPNGTVTAGVNDGAAAMILASETAVKRHGLRPRGRILGKATAGVAPRVMGIGPLPATQALMAQLGLTIAAFDVIALNEAFASQALAVLRAHGLSNDADHVNPLGGAIAPAQPLGMTGARLAPTAPHALEARGGRSALCALRVGVGVGVGVGQGVAPAIERIDPLGLGEPGKVTSPRPDTALL